VLSQKDAEAVASELQKQDVQAYPYHSNLHPDDKTKVHHKWAKNKIQVRIDRPEPAGTLLAVMMIIMIDWLVD